MNFLKCIIFHTVQKKNKKINDENHFEIAFISDFVRLPFNEFIKNLLKQVDER